MIDIYGVIFGLVIILLGVWTFNLNLRFSRIIGNIFLVDRKIILKVIALSAAVTFVGYFVTAILRNQSIVKIFDIQTIVQEIIISNLVGMFIAGGITYKLIKNYSLIKEFKKYFKLKAATFVPLFGEILILMGFISYVILMISAGSLKYAVYILFFAIFFFGSGIQRIIIQKSNALFQAPYPDFMKFIGMYGYVRATYYALAIIFFFQIIYILPSVQIVFFTGLLVLEILFMANLYPYWTEHEDIKKTIEILRTVAKNKNIKINAITSLINMPNKFVEQQLERLEKVGNYIIIEKNHVRLTDEYQKIYKGEW